MTAVAERTAEASHAEIEDAGVDNGRGRLRRAPRRAMGLFRHPSDFTEEEFAIIVDSLKANIPVYRIAAQVRCERHTLGKFINDTPELRQLKDEQEENLFEEGKYQLSRLMQQGNSAAVIYALDKLGQRHGWSPSGEGGGGSGGGGDRIVMGLIPPEEVEEAERLVAEKRAELPPMTVAGVEVKPPGSEMAELLTDPAKMAAMEQQAKEAYAAEKAAELNSRAANAKPVTPDFVSGSLGSREALMNGSVAQAGAAAEPEVMPSGYDEDFGAENYDPSMYFG